LSFHLGFRTSHSLLQPPQSDVFPDFVVSCCCNRVRPRLWTESVFFLQAPPAAPFSPALINPSGSYSSQSYFQGRFFLKTPYRDSSAKPLLHLSLFRILVCLGFLRCGFIAITSLITSFYPSGPRCNLLLPFIAVCNRCFPEVLYPSVLLRFPPLPRPTIAQSPPHLGRFFEIHSEQNDSR